VNETAVAIIYQCKCCSQLHLSPTQVFQESAFNSLQMQSYFDNIRYFCAGTGRFMTYGYEDHSWLNDAMLPKLCSLIVRWLQQNGQESVIPTLTGGELLPSGAGMSRTALPPNATLSLKAIA
jgi:hypothetical protein